MKKFDILSTENHRTPFVVVATSYINPLGSIVEVQNDSTLMGFKGDILFDNLLSSGFSSNRFISIGFKDGRFDYSSVKIVDDVGKDILGLTYEFFYNNPTYVDMSILPSPQKHILNNNLFAKELM
ncbi:type II toxin-antitoxin system RnlB family antitoxin [Rossellomorea marisflavi]|uniref:type II toxin-antitoxin system RnlB family antitoxin n=1 Tax=Rossellomorea marisflavi TaxID=189381 RepID=UPI003FA01900